jgi:DNA repair exonuclease SbcCD nuclease subunit
MSKPLEALISDTHNHNWSVFSKMMPDGMNNRLQIILDETWRAAVVAKDAGASALIHTGDIFHVRGSVAPSVLNPTVELYARIVNELGLNVYLLAGNHDLEGKNSTSLGNAGEALAGVGVTVVSSVFADHRNKRLFVPYFDSCDAVRKQINDFIASKGGDAKEIAEWTLYLHAPLNGVLVGLPDHGFNPVELEAFGFKHVFCGHYHNHKRFDSVTSVGALTHQTFSDIGSKAGFVLFNRETNAVTHYTSNSPRFTDFDETWDDLSMVEQVAGNYVRVRLSAATNDEIEGFRKDLEEMGAAGVQIVHVPKVEVSREGGSSIEAGASIRVSLNDWCKSRGYEERVGMAAQSIMDEVEAKV